MWFFCQTIRADGSCRWRWVRSPSLYDCLRTLLQQRCFPKRLFCPQKIFSFPIQRLTKKTQWCTLFQELHAYLHQGASLISACKQLPANMLSPEQQMLVVHAVDRLQQGQYMYPLFQPFVATLGASAVQLLRTSETNGYLEQGIQQIQLLLSTQIQARQKIRRALVYPACLFGMMGIFGMVASTFLLPQLEEFLYQQNVAVSPFVETVLQLNHHAGTIAFFCCMVVALVIFLIRKKYGSVLSFFLQKIGRRWFVYHLFTLNASVLLTNRVPLLQSLQLAARDLLQKEFLFQSIHKRMLEGETLAQALIGFPKDFRESLIAAEIRGDLVQTLQQWSQRYYQRYEACWMRACKWVEPVCITGIAILILGGMLILFLPLLQTFLSMNGNLG